MARALTVLQRPWLDIQSLEPGTIILTPALESSHKHGHSFLLCVSILMNWSWICSRELREYQLLENKREIYFHYPLFWGGSPLGREGARALTTEVPSHILNALAYTPGLPPAGLI